MRSLSAVVTVWMALTIAPNGSAQPARTQIDVAITQAWKQEGIEPSALSDDAIFLRRVYLDLAGWIPTYEETKKFLDDSSRDKREKLIDRLLEDPRYAVHQADIWDAILFGRNPPGYYARDRNGFQQWLREQFAKNTPYDQWAQDILKAKGTSLDGPPMYLIQYERRPLDATVAISQTFLGVQLQCARCHDHPFENWKQTEFYGMAAFLARLQMVQLKKKGKTANLVIGEKNTGDVLFTGPAANQSPGKKGKPIQPKFLQGAMLKEPPLPKVIKDPRRFPGGKIPPKPHFSRKDALADWITSPTNPWFAKAVTNRIWAQFMGRGLIHPVDNLKGGEATHPELLETLAKGLVKNQFNLKWLIREICNSRAYQLSHTGTSTEPFPQWFERARTRPLSAEELLESWLVATGYKKAVTKKRNRESERFQGVTWGYMLRFFGQPNNGVGDFQGGLHEHLYLNNGQVRQVIVTGKGGLHHALMSSKDPWEKKVDRLYLSVLNRYPRAEERTKFVAYLSTGNTRERISEAIWTLMTCSEFRFNH